MSGANERELVILRLLDALGRLGFDLEDCMFTYDRIAARWVVTCKEHAAQYVPFSEDTELDEEYGS